ncbi:MAG: deoxynucleoside kinase [Deltaproteobacteria bacterium]|nr:deoxynucleoside kinase [Deltaproteobacteria bacterium]
MAGNNKRFVALAGNIGTGKTTVAKLVSRRLGYELFDEPVIDNRFLAAYYGDMRRWSFTLQLEFLIKRVNHHQLIETVPKSCIQDRTLIEDPEIFAKYLHGLGHMTDDELQLYLEYFDRLNDSIRQPERIIYLQCHDVETLLKRIHRRGRKEEGGISAEFLAGLNGYYSAFPSVVKSKHGIEVMTFDVTHFDVHNPAQADAFLALAQPFLES